MGTTSGATELPSWRQHWLVSNWLAAVPLLRIVTLTSGRDALLALGGDVVMLAGMLIGMDLGSDEVAFLGTSAGWSRAGGQAEFGHLVGVMITLTMVLGMAAGMILWTTLAPLLGLSPDQAEAPRSELRQGWRDRLLVRRYLAFVPCLRALCQPSMSQACLELCADAMAIAGMLAGMAVVHELAMGSATPVRGLPMALVLATGMGLGMGAGGAAWNTVVGITRACRSILLPRRDP